MTDTLRGAALMVAAMALFSVEDALIKATSMLIPAGQVLIVMGVGGSLAYWALLRRKGLPLFTRALLTPAVLLRNACELVSTACFIAAITLGDLATASAILQAVPLAVVMGAALFLGEPVGWRRWTAVGLGFLGVLIVVRPGTAGFDPVSLLAVVAVLGLSARDLVTRRIPAGVPSNQLSAFAFVMIVPSGLILLVLLGERPVMPPPLAWAGLGALLVLGMGAYSTLIAATRIGELSVIAPFRYSRILFALLIASLVFGERPDGWTLVGAALIVGSGLYAWWRESRRASLAGQATL